MPLLRRKNSCAPKETVLPPSLNRFLFFIFCEAWNFRSGKSKGADPKHLDHVLRAIRGVDAVYDVYRINQ